MNRRQIGLSLLLLLSLTIGERGAAAPRPSQDASRPSDPPPSSIGMDATVKSAVTPEFLQSKLKELEAASDLEETVKNRLAEQYRKALSDLEAVRSLDAKTASFKEAVESAPKQTEAIRKALAAGEAEAPMEPPPIPEGLAIDEIEQRLAKTQADAAAVGAKLAEIEKELESSADRPAAARQAISEAKRKLEELDGQADLPPPEGEPQVLTNARRWALEAQRQALRSAILMLDQELLSQPVRVELLKAQRDKASRDLEGLKSGTRRLEDRLNAMRSAEAEEARSKAEEGKREAAGKHPLVQMLAQGNAEISKELTALTEELNRIGGLQDQIEKRTLSIDEAFRSARQRVEAAGLTQALGQVLIDQRNQLPDLRAYKKAAAEREKSITEATLDQIRYGEELRRLRDLDAYVAELIRGRVAPEKAATVSGELRELAERRKSLLEQASHADEAYLRVLGEVDFASSQLMESVKSYDDFLSEHLLWVRSILPVTLQTFGALPRALLWAISPSNWLEVAQTILYEGRHSALFWLVLALMLTLRLKTPAMRRRIRATEEHLRRVHTDSIIYTLEALALTLMVAAPISLLLAFLGWQLFASLEATSFTKAIGEAAISVSLGLYYLLSFRVLCMQGGVADRHFRWRGDVLTSLRRNFDWLLVVLVPLGFIAVAAHSYPDVTYGSSLGRVAMIALMVGLAVFFARVLNPRRGAIRNLIREHPEIWLNRLRKIWYPVVVAIPLALAILTVIGYLYTAGILLRSLVSSMYLVLALTVAHQLIIRWLILTRRRLVLLGALERRAAHAAEEPWQTADEVEKEAVRAEVPDEIDLASLDEQTRRLLNSLLFIGGAVALWVIWSHVLPAFGIFEGVALWHHTGVVDGSETIVPVTLADIGLVLVIALTAIVAARNLPALLEILLLSRMALSPGSRYAVKTLTAYVITAVAALMVFSTLGLSWGQVQWLVAALGVGIGFGLQEIVANFISGIIILFERPVRVGDVVTIGDTTGTVSRIQIRATTIRNWDKQELLVPNKEFITGRLLNWTLSDTTNRIVIPVGVDYGADIPLALALLEEAAKENERVLEDPAPLITFEGFGDNALNLVLRCYLESLDNRLAVISALHQSINEKFRAAGISIAFPQRDVHLSTAHPLDVRIHRSWPEAAEPPP
jgi:potassium efflux system protein